MSVSITPVVLDRSFLVFGARFDALEPRAMQISGQLTAADTITFARVASAGAPAVSIVWYVAEFHSGVLVQRGSSTMTSQQVQASLAAPVEPEHAFPIISYRNDGSALGMGDLVRAKLTGVNGLQLSAGAAAPAGTVEWQVVSYADAVVQSGDVAYALTETAPVVSIPALDQAKAWLIHTYDYTSATTNNIGQKLFRGRFSSPSTIQFLRGSNGTQGTITWYAVRFTNGTVVHPGAAGFSGNALTSTVGVGTYAVGKTLAAGSSWYMRGGSTNYNDTLNAGVCSATLTKAAPDDIVAARGTTGGTSSNCDANFWAVEFP